MRKFLTLFLALFVSVAFAACEQSPVGMDRDSSSLTPSGKPAHAHGPVVVDENPEHGWIFNRDPGNVTPAGFSFDEAVLGSGSLHADPISGAGSAKFILEYFPVSGIPVSDFDEFSIEFLMDGDETKFKQFYINVYAVENAGSSPWSGCRFDYVATTGSTSTWTTLGTDTPPDRASSGCTTLAEMPGGSVIALVSFNIGDSSTNDNGVGGYFDNALLTVSGSTTTFDFEPNCKDGGWESLTRPDGSSFKNQGQCMKYQKTGK